MRLARPAPLRNRIIVGIARIWYCDGGLLVLVDVELDDLQVVALAGDLLEDRGDDAARTAPRRPEVHQHGLVGLDDLGLEVRVGDFVDVPAMRRSFRASAYFRKYSDG